MKLIVYLGAFSNAYILSFSTNHIEALGIKSQKERASFFIIYFMVLLAMPLLMPICIKSRGNSVIRDALKDDVLTATKGHLKEYSKGRQVDKNASGSGSDPVKSATMINSIHAGGVLTGIEERAAFESFVTRARATKLIQRWW
eukprot:gene32895-41941_t